MAYQPDDDRFYDSLNRAGQTYLDQRGKVAEDQAATTREIGALGAQALTGTVNGAMTGAQWAQNRAAQQQKMDLAQTSEQRAQQKFTEDQQDAQHQRDIQATQEAFEGAPAEESFATGAGVEYHPGMTHQDVERMAGANHLGFEGKKLTSEEQRAKDVQAGENSRTDKRIAAEQGLEGTKLANSIKLEGMRTASAKEIAGMKADAVKPPKDLPPQDLDKISDADNALKALDSVADEYKTKVGTFSGIMQGVPGSSAKQYNDAVYVHAKNIADYLKNGRGSATKDDIQYTLDNLIPPPGDSPDRAAAKLTRLSQEIADKKNGHVHNLQVGNYELGGIDLNPAIAKKYNLRDKTTPNQAVAAPDDENANLSPAELQDKLVRAAAGRNAVPMPKVGDVVMGHKYIGGDPKLPTSWEK